MAAQVKQVNRRSRQVLGGAHHRVFAASQGEDGAVMAAVTVPVQ
jgi:hypothetical protein